MSKVYKSPPSGLSIIATFSGLMMRYKDRYVVAVRCADGSIKEKIQTFNTPFVSSRLLQTPFIRGFFSFIEYMYLTIYSRYSREYFAKSKIQSGKIGKGSRLEK